MKVQGSGFRVQRLSTKANPPKANKYRIMNVESTRGGSKEGIYKTANRRTVEYRISKEGILSRRA